METIGGRIDAVVASDRRFSFLGGAGRIYATARGEVGESTRQIAEHDSECGNESALPRRAGRRWGDIITSEVTSSLAARIGLLQRYRVPLPI